MNTLEQLYKNSPDLLHMYKTKLLIPGWAGELDDTEAAYVAEKLNSDRQLWLSWRRAGHLKGMRRHVTPENAKILAEKLATTPLAEFDSRLLKAKGIMKHPVLVQNDVQGEIPVIMKHPGRPKKFGGDMSRITRWRRQKEAVQGAMPL